TINSCKQLSTHLEPKPIPIGSYGSQTTHLPTPEIRQLLEKLTNKDAVIRAIYPQKLSHISLHKLGTKFGYQNIYILDLQA
ncbi:MAG: hypothetical protein EBX50_23200, partial [Chitinophagia bacterium]|nr:hypothetical protein [Chitinophagia bacterium]